MSIFDRIARRPDCLLAVDATTGGRLVSPCGVGGNAPAAPTGTGTWEQQTGLLTYTNMAIKDGAFDRVDKTAAAGIATRLDLRGNKTSKTFIVRATLVKPPDVEPRFFYHAFLTQGYQIGAAAATVCGLGVFCDYRTKEYHRLQCGFGGSSTVSAQYELPPTARTGAHVFAGVVDYEKGMIVLYVDGVYVYRISFDRTRVFPTENAETTLSIRKTQHLPADTESTISQALIFDAALSDGEIAAISKILA